MQWIKKSRIYVLMASFSLLVFCFNAPAGGGDGDEDKILQKLKRTLDVLHYAPKSVDNTFSEKVFDTYINDLDPYKRFFTKEDISEFNQSKDLLDDYFTDGDVSFHNKVIDRMYQRLDDAEKITTQILSKPINLDSDDYYVLDEEKKDFSKNKKEWEKDWERYIKYQILYEAYTANETEQEKNDSLKIANPKHLSKAEQLDEATKTVKENLSEYFRKSKIKKKEDYFSVYANAYTTNYDPHTNYFSPKEVDDFGAQISGKFEGIGATLQDKKGYPTIMGLIIGGPAWKTKKLDAGDKILKVAQGSNEAVNVVGMSLDDAILLIKGKKGTKVVLTVQKKNGTVEEIPIVRDEVEIEESYAKSAILSNETGDRYGLISFPSFYMPFNGKVGRNASDDIKAEIIELKKQNIKGIILDLRNNGGGSLNEVVEIMGLFIKNGPVVQVKNSDGAQNLHEDTDSSIEWDGNVTVLVNDFSASASEILAGAIQDYRRGIIIGSHSTYGKGTVQTVVPLDRFSFSASNSGDVKLTIQKYYRVTGNSVQQKGVSSDVVIPELSDVTELKESAQKTALPWDQINGTVYTPWNSTYDLSKIKANSESRMNQNSHYQLLKAGAKWYETLRKQEKITLNYEKFMAEMKQRKDESKKYEDKKYNTNLTINFHSNDLAKIAKDTIFKAKRDDWKKSLKRDFQLEETVRIMSEM